jgi:Domain of unknown function (DUF4340)
MDKRVIIAAGILVVVLAAVFFAVNRDKKPPQAQTEEAPFAELRAERPKKGRNWVHPVLKKIDRMEVTKDGKTAKLKRIKAGDMRRDFGEWEVVAPYKYPADPFAVRQVLQRLTSLRFWEPFSKDAKDHAAAGVDSSGFRVAVFQGSRKIADLYLGKEIKTTLGDRPLTYTYLRAHGSSTVWKLKGSLKSMTRKDVNGWREPKILRLKRDEIFEISLTAATGSVVLVRDANEKNPKKRNKNWKIKSATPPLDSIEQGDISRMASTLSYLRAKDFADKVKLAEAGLDKPLFTLSLKAQAKSKSKAKAKAKDEKKNENKSAVVKTYTLLFGKTITKKVKRGKREVDEKLVYLKVKAKPQIFLMQEARLKSLMKSPSELRNRTIVKLDKGQRIVRLEVHKGKEKIILAMEKLKWKAVEPKDLKFTDASIKRDVKMLTTRFTAKEFSKEKDPKKTGLDKPEGRLIVTLETAPPKPPQKAKKGDKGKPAPKVAVRPAGPVKRVVLELLVGKTVNKRERYVQIKGKPDIYIIRVYTLERIWKGKNKWKPAKRRPGGRGMGDRGMPGRGMRGMPGRGMPGRGMPGRGPGRRTPRNIRMPPRRR